MVRASELRDPAVTGTWCFVSADLNNKSRRDQETFIVCSHKDYHKWEVRELRPPLYSGVRNYGPPKMHILREPFSIISHNKAILESGKEKRQAQKAR